METIVLQPIGFSSNCYIIHDGQSALVIDPSVSERRVLSALEKYSLRLEGILLTHGHFDHILRADELRAVTGAPLYVHKDDAEMLSDSEKNAYALFTGKEFTISDADVLLTEGDRIQLGKAYLTVLHTPGHTKGSVCYDAGDALFTGDTIFADSFGRYDLFGGDLSALKSSIARLCEMAKNKDRVIYTGHGDISSLKSAAKILKNYFKL